MLVLAIAGALWSAVPALAPAVPAWVALALLWRGIERRQRMQALVFMAAGLAALVWGASRGAAPRIDSVLGQNQPILSMLAAITLLRLLKPALFTKVQIRPPKGVIGAGMGLGHRRLQAEPGLSSRPGGA